MVNISRIPPQGNLTLSSSVPAFLGPTVFQNYCRWNSTTLGLAAFTVGAAAATDSSGAHDIPENCGAINGMVYRYYAQSRDGLVFESGRGVYNTVSHTLTRVTIFYNSDQTDVPINFLSLPIVDIFPSPSSSLSSGSSSSASLNYNYIINGAMIVSQENGTSAGTTSGYYAADQFFDTISFAGACSFGQVASATPAGSPNRIRFTVTSADASVGASDQVTIIQRIEGLRVAGLLYGTASAKTMTLRFGVKAPAGTYCVTFVNSATNRSYVSEYTISAGEANTDVVKSVTVPGDQSGTWLKTVGIGLEVRWGLMAGSGVQQTAGSWGTGNPSGSSSQFNIMGTNSNVFELFDVSLTEGTVAPSFQLLDIVIEMDQCQRYFWMETVSQTIYVENVSVGSGGNNVACTVKYPTVMRVVPTPTFSGGFTSSGVGGIGVTAASVHQMSLFATSNVSVGVRMYFFALAPVKFNARL